MAVETSLFDGTSMPRAAKPPVLSDSQKQLVGRIFGDRTCRPLVVIGSGVSREKVPDMRAVFRYLSDRIGQEKLRVDSQSHSLVQSQTFLETSELASSLAGGLRHRPLAARLFGELQDTTVPGLRAVWNKFCIDFLNGDIDGRKQPLAELEPSKGHRALAQLCELTDSLVLSFNFDGLTYRAMQEQFRARGDRVFILDEPAKIREFYGRNPTVQRDWAVWKVRGDVFFAVCSQSGCPSRRVASPIYKLTQRQAPQAAVDAEKVLECPECGSLRSLRISFPGLEQKERDTDAIVAELWRYVVPTLSGICIVGLSGIWDESIVASLLRVAAFRGIPVLDVRPEPSEPDPDDKHIAGLHSSLYPSVEYSRILDTAEHFFSSATAARDLVTATLPKSELHSESLPSDELWDKSGDFSVPGWSQGLPVASRSTELSYHIAHHAAVRHLSVYSQLGLKDYWWGRESFSRHSRYQHSVGTLRIAAWWHEGIKNAVKRNVRRATNHSIENERSLMMLAALLHDYGHVPFSHLCEQIFSDLNWSPSPFGKPYNHLDVGADKIKTFLSTQSIQGTDVAHEIRAHLSAIGYTPGDVINLIRGATGVAYLDAIVNSPIDADKIDYIFRDSLELNLGVRLPPRDAWLQAFLADQDVSSEGMIRLNGQSAIRMIELLDTRKTLYEDFYLSPSIRAIEAIAASVIMKFLIVSVSREMKKQLDEGTLPDPDPDWGALKIRIASKQLEGLYEEVLAAKKEDGARKLEQPLLVRIIDLLQEEELGRTFDGGYRQEFLPRVKMLLQEFDEPSSKGHGEILRSLFQRVHLAGPFRVRNDQRSALQSVVREVQLLYPDKVFFATYSSPRFLSTSDDRVCTAEPVGECILVPEGSPSSWTMKSEARVPLHGGQFKHLENPFTSVVLIDPWEGARLSGRYVLDVFKRQCKRAGITLLE